VSNFVPFNRAKVAPNQVKYVRESMSSGHISGDGPFTRRASDHLSRIHNDSAVLLTTSCTSALEIAALLLDLNIGDEVIVPSFTFVSSANAFALRGAKIVFVDICKSNWNLDPDEVARAIGPKTKAIVAVNYAGSPAVTASLIQIAKEANLPIIEDNAHGLFAKDLEQPLGVLSSMSTLSFHETKNVTCGEGGGLVINEPRFIERAEIIREKGTNRSKFFRGMIDKYTWIDKGSSYLLSDINAAVLLAQLEDARAIQENRKLMFDYYFANLLDWAEQCGAKLPDHLNHTDSSYHMFPILMPNYDDRSSLINHARNASVNLVFHYIPLHSSPGGKLFGHAFSKCSNSISISDRVLRLPLFSDMNTIEAEQVVETLISFNRRSRK
jgi:dTDP-4-amino-4,6-dideoxygalactose transaminase